MHVYGELNGTLTSAGRLRGTLVGDHHKIQGALTIPNTPGLELYGGPYEVTPRLYAQSLDTDGKLMEDDVTVYEIPVTRTTNPTGGLTVLIG